MAAWRRIAQQRFPQLQAEIERSDSPAALWGELKREFDRAYAYDEIKTISAIHEYAQWTIVETRSLELAAVAVEALYRPLIEHSWAAADFAERRKALELANYLSKDQLTSLYWGHLHALVPPGKHRDFIAELGIGKPARKPPPPC